MAEHHPKNKDFTLTAHLYRRLRYVHYLSETSYLDIYLEVSLIARRIARTNRLALIRARICAYRKGPDFISYTNLHICQDLPLDLFVGPVCRRDDYCVPVKSRSCFFLGLLIWHEYRRHCIWL